MVFEELIICHLVMEELREVFPDLLKVIMDVVKLHVWEVLEVVRWEE